MGHVDVAGIRYELPDGRVLLDDVSFRVGEGAKVALVGANGAGKTTLLRIVTGDLEPHAGTVTRDGRSRRDAPVGQPRPRRHDRARPAAVGRAAAACAGGRARRRGRAGDDGGRRREDPDGVRRRRCRTGPTPAATTIEVLWDVCTTAALGIPYDKAKYREVTHAVRRRAEAARPRGAAARPGRGAAARRARQLPRRARQALARGAAARVAEDGPVRQPRPRADEQHRDPGRHRRARRGRQHRLGAPRRLRDVPPRRDATGSSGSRSCAGAGTRSTPSSRRSC